MDKTKLNAGKNHYKITKTTTFPYQIVYIKPSAVEIITRHYNLKYPEAKIKIQTIFATYDFEDHIPQEVLKMKAGEFLGLMLYAGDEISKDSLPHVEPYLLFKTPKNEYYVVDFESTGNITRALQKKGLKAITLNVDVGNYQMFQLDSRSCSVFAYNALKNAFLDRDFLESVKIGKKPLSLSKTKIAQACGYFAFDKETLAKYIVQEGDKQINCKAFIEGHEMAMVVTKILRQDQKRISDISDINEEKDVLQARDEHFALLNQATRDAIMKIETARQEWRQKHDLQGREERSEELDLFKSVISQPKMAKQLHGDKKDGADISHC